MRLCLRCKMPVNKPYRYHIKCKKEAEAELRAKIEALPTKVLTEEQVLALFAPSLTPFELQK